MTDQEQRIRQLESLLEKERATNRELASRLALSKLETEQFRKTHGATKSSITTKKTQLDDLGKSDSKSTSSLQIVQLCRLVATEEEALAYRRILLTVSGGRSLDDALRYELSLGKPVPALLPMLRKLRIPPSIQHNPLPPVPLFESIVVSGPNPDEVVSMLRSNHMKTLASATTVVDGFQKPETTQDDGIQSIAIDTITSTVLWNWPPERDLPMSPEEFAEFAEPAGSTICQLQLPHTVESQSLQQIIMATGTSNLYKPPTYQSSKGIKVSAPLPINLNPLFERKGLRRGARSHVFLLHGSQNDTDETVSNAEAIGKPSVSNTRYCICLSVQEPISRGMLFGLKKKAHQPLDDSHVAEPSADFISPQLSSIRKKRLSRASPTHSSLSTPVKLDNDYFAVDSNDSSVASNSKSVANSSKAVIQKNVMRDIFIDEPVTSGTHLNAKIMDHSYFGKDRKVSGTGEVDSDDTSVEYSPSDSSDGEDLPYTPVKGTVVRHSSFFGSPAGTKQVPGVFSPKPFSPSPLGLGGHDNPQTILSSINSPTEVLDSIQTALAEDEILFSVPRVFTIITRYPVFSFAVDLLVLVATQWRYEVQHRLRDMYSKGYGAALCPRITYIPRDDSPERITFQSLSEEALAFTGGADKSSQDDLPAPTVNQFRISSYQAIDDSSPITAASPTATNGPNKSPPSTADRLVAAISRSNSIDLDSPTPSYADSFADLESVSSSRAGSFVLGAGQPIPFSSKDVEKEKPKKSSFSAFFSSNTSKPNAMNIAEPILQLGGTLSEGNGTQQTPLVSPLQGQDVCFVPDAAGHRHSESEGGSSSIPKPTKGDEKNKSSGWASSWRALTAKLRDGNSDSNSEKASLSAKELEDTIDRQLSTKSNALSINSPYFSSIESSSQSNDHSIMSSLSSRNLAAKLGLGSQPTTPKLGSNQASSPALIGNANKSSTTHTGKVFGATYPPRQFSPVHGALPPTPPVIKEDPLLPLVFIDSVVDAWTEVIVPKQTRKLIARIMVLPVPAPNTAISLPIPASCPRPSPSVKSVTYFRKHVPELEKLYVDEEVDASCESSSLRLEDSRITAQSTPTKGSDNAPASAIQSPAKTPSSTPPKEAATSPNSNENSFFARMSRRFRNKDNDSQDDCKETEKNSAEVKCPGAASSVCNDSDVTSSALTVKKEKVVTWNLGRPIHHVETREALIAHSLPVLLSLLHVDSLLLLLGAALSEHRIVFVAGKLSMEAATSGALALHSLLAPLSWTGSFMPTLTARLEDLLLAPFPVIAGVPCLPDHWEQDEDTLVVHLDAAELSIFALQGDSKKASETSIHKPVRKDNKPQNERTQQATPDRAVSRSFSSVLGFSNPQEDFADIQNNSVDSSDDEEDDCILLPGYLEMQIPGSSTLFHKLEPMVRPFLAQNVDSKAVAEGGTLHANQLPLGKPCYQPTEEQQGAAFSVAESIKDHLEALIDTFLSAGGASNNLLYRPEEIPSHARNPNPKEMPLISSALSPFPNVPMAEDCLSEIIQFIPEVEIPFWSRFGRSQMLAYHLDTLTQREHAREKMNAHRLSSKFLPPSNKTSSPTVPSVSLDVFLGPSQHETLEITSGEPKDIILHPSNSSSEGQHPTPPQTQNSTSDGHSPLNTIQIPKKSEPTLPSRPLATGNMDISFHSPAARRPIASMALPHPSLATRGSVFFEASGASHRPATATAPIPVDNSLSNSALHSSVPNTPHMFRRFQAAHTPMTGTRRPIHSLAMNATNPKPSNSRPASMAIDRPAQNFVGVRNTLNASQLDPTIAINPLHAAYNAREYANTSSVRLSSGSHSSMSAGVSRSRNSSADYTAPVGRSVHSSSFGRATLPRDLNTITPESLKIIQEAANIATAMGSVPDDDIPALDGWNHTPVTGFGPAFTGDEKQTDPIARSRGASMSIFPESVHANAINNFNAATSFNRGQSSSFSGEETSASLHGRSSAVSKRGSVRLTPSIVSSLSVSGTDSTASGTLPNGAPSNPDAQNGARMQSSSTALPRIDPGESSMRPRRYSIVADSSTLPMQLNRPIAELGYPHIDKPDFTSERRPTVLSVTLEDDQSEDT